jgi:hypothetical protein
VAKPKEFTIVIEPDGRIILDVGGMQETSYKRILEYLEETVGPVRLVEVSPSDPPQRHLQPVHEDEDAQERRELRIDQGTGG